MIYRLNLQQMYQKYARDSPTGYTDRPVEKSDIAKARARLTWWEMSTHMNSHGLSLVLGLCMYGGLKATGRQRALKKSPSLP